MTRRSILHVLLSLLLLASQQMALSHAMAHWTSPRQGNAHLSAPGEARLGKALAQEQSCDQCLAFAQLASAVGSTVRPFAAFDLVAFKIAAFAPASERRRTIRVFQSRAPPVLA
jgi:hypothetical protein